jgi:hypothetical protein
MVTTLAGNSSSGSTNGTGTAAAFNNPRMLATDASDNLYVPDLSNGLIRKITPAGVVTTFASGLNGPGGVAVDASGNVYVAEYSGGRVLKYTSAGGANFAIIATGISNPSGIAVDYAGNVFVAEQDGSSVYKITPAGVRTTFASGLRNPTGVALDASGNVYVAELNAHLIRKYTPTGATNIILAGSGSAAFADGSGTAASFSYPHGLAVDPLGNVYVADVNSNRVRKITPDGVVTTLAGTGAVSSLNGSGSAATFNAPAGIAIDPSGNIYVSEYYGHNIRKITQTTISCNGNPLTLSAGGGTSYSWTGPQNITNGTSFNSLTSGLYTVTATNANCTVKQVIYDSVVTLPVTGPTNSLTSPLCSGFGTQTLSVTATVTGNTLSYQWYKGTGISTDTLLTNTAPFTTTTTAALTLTNPSDSYKGNYYVKVTSSLGNCVVKSNNINVVINPAPSFTITSNTPSTGFIPTSATVTFTASSITNFGQSPTYQWTRNGNVVSSALTYAGTGWGVAETIACKVTSTGNAPCGSVAAVTKSIIVQVENTTANSWVAKKAPQPTLVRRNLIGFSILNKGYIGLGTTDNTNGYSDFWEYDPEANSWTQKANFAGGQRFLAVAFSIGDLGYVGTGQHNGAYYKDFYQYSPSTNQWTAKADFPDNRSGAAAFSIGAIGYVGCGYSAATSSNTKSFYAYNSKTNRWNDNMPVADYGKAADPAVKQPIGFSIQNKGYVGGGYSDGWKNNFYEYNPGSNVWTQKDPIPGPIREGIVSFSMGSLGYVGGGHVPGSGVNPNYPNNPTEFYSFNPANSNTNTTNHQWVTKSGFGYISDGYAFGIGNKGYAGLGWYEHGSGGCLGPYYFSNDVLHLYPYYTWCYENRFSGSQCYEYSPTATKIKTGNLTSLDLCKTSTLVIPYTIGSTTFNDANVFRAELSDEFGSFANPINISVPTVSNGTTIQGFKSAISGQFSAIIPANTVAGTKYRIRVVGSDPLTYGTVTDSAISVVDLPDAGSIGNEHTVPYPAHMNLDSVTNVRLADNSMYTTTYTWQKRCDAFDWRDITEINTVGINSLAANALKLNTSFGKDTSFSYRRKVQFSCNANAVSNVVKINVFHKNNIINGQPSKNGFISGRVVSNGTSTGVQNVEVTLEQLDPLKGSNAGYKYVTNTDGSGYYKFDTIYYGDETIDIEKVRFKISAYKYNAFTPLLKDDIRISSEWILLHSNNNTDNTKNYYYDSLTSYANISNQAPNNQNFPFVDFTTYSITGTILQKCADCITLYDITADTVKTVGLKTDNLNEVAVSISKYNSSSTTFLPFMTDTSGSGTNGNGNYALTVAERNDYRIKPTSSGYRFSPSFADFTIDANRSNVNFTDDTTHTVSGIFRAGGNELIGSVRLEFSDTVLGRPSVFIKQVTTSDSGKYSINLPPRKYKVRVVSYIAPFLANNAYRRLEKFTTTDNKMYLVTTAGTSGNQQPSHISGTASASGGTAVFKYAGIAPNTNTSTSASSFARDPIVSDSITRFFNTILKESMIVDLSKVDDTLDFIFHRPPTMEIVGLNDTCNGLTVFYQYMPKKFAINLYEGKKFHNYKIPTDENDKVYVITSVINLNNENDTLITIPVNGVDSVNFISSAPNLFEDPTDHSKDYMKYFELQYTDKYGRFLDSIKAKPFVDGYKAATGTFTTVTPEIPILILHQPPGDGSSSKWEQNNSTETVWRISREENNGLSGSFQVKLGPCFDVPVGGQDFSLETLRTISGEFSSSKTTVNQREAVVKTTNSVAYETTADGGDLFVGGALNMNYAVGDIRELVGCRINKRYDYVMQPTGYATTYTYSEKHIKEVLIPTLQDMADLITATDENSLKQKEKYQSSARTWSQVLDNNNHNKENASFVRNRSFDGAAGPITETTTAESSESNSIDISMEIDRTIGAEFGLFFAGVGASGTVSSNFKLTTGEGSTVTNTTETVIGYTLDDNDAGDYFSVDVSKDKVYNTPVFKMVAGTSSCPPEAGAQNRDLCILDISSNVNGLPNKVQRNIPTNGEVLYQLLLRNNSESREARQFLLSFDQGSNPNGAIITIGGSPASTPVLYSIPFRGTQIVTVSVKKNPVSNVYSYDGLSFVLSDACDEEALADEKQSFSKNTISAFFQSACSDINLSAPANNFSVNSNVDNLPVTFNGYVRNNLQTVTIEYAHIGQGDWQPGAIINQNAIATNSIIGTTYPWDTHDVEDGNYEVRLKLTCSSGITYSNRATGIIDRTAPILFGRPQPADNNYIAGDEISYTYNEYINTSNLNFDKVKLIRKENNYEIPVQVSGYQNKINIVPTQNLVTVYAGDTLLIIAKNIADLYGNIKTDPDTTLFVVGTEAQIAAAKRINITNLRTNKTSIYENSGDTLLVKFKFADNTPLTNNTTVKYLISGSAAYNSGYTVSYTNGQNLSTMCNGSQGTIVIPANSDSAVLKIHPVADFVYEENEIINITLITGGDYRIGTSYMVKDTIKNDDYIAPIITASGGLCPGGSIVLSTPTQIEGINITAYQWRLNDTIVGTSTNTISVNRPGAYTVKVTTDNGFTGISNVYNVATSISPVSTTNMAICRGSLPYLWNGLSINAVGNYSATLSNSDGCDSIANLVISIKEPTTGIETIYTDEAPYIWHDVEYYTSNDEATFTEVNAVGCDSVVTLHLTISNTCLNTRATFNASACNSYTWHGMRITTSQTLVWYTTNAAGCDSIETLNLIINKPTSSTTKAAICSNQMPYVYNGYTYNNPGTYSRRLVNAGGCDSIAKLIITLKYPTTSTRTITVCNNQLPYVWNGLNLSTSGNYSVTLTNAVGCDSVANIVFTVKNTSTSTAVYTSCSNQLPYLWNGLTLNTAGTYSATLINAAGCDSVASINFSVNNTTSSLTTTTICSNVLPYAWNGQALSAAGTYSATLAGRNGCDSIATIVLSVIESPIAVVNANGPTTFCSGGSVTLTAANQLSILNGANDSAYASSVINISSEYLPCPNIWSSCQLLGAPNTYPRYGDIPTAWTAASFGNREFLELGFNHSTPINYIDIFETYNPGYIDTVYVKNPNTGLFEVVYTGTAQNAGNQSRIMHIEFPTTAFNVSEIRIAINLEGLYNYYELDAVKIGKRSVADETSVDQYLWSNGATTKSIVPSISGTYTVTATAPNGCTLTSAPVDVTILTNNTYAVTGGGSYCEGGTGNAIGLDGSEAGVRYQLKLNGGYVGQPQEGTGAALNFGVFNNQGRYTVDATNTTTSCIKAMSGFADISIISLPNFAVTPTTASVCIGGSVQLAVSDANNYCMPTNSNPAVSNISEVHLNTLHSYLNQQSNQVHFNEPVNNNTTMLVAGQSYELSLTTVSWANSNTSVWIDYNNNGLFELNEWVKLWSDARTGSVMINVPANAINGLTRLRVRSDFTWYQLLAENACSDRQCGTTEDYMVNIQGGLSPETLQYTWNNGASIGNTFVATPSASTEYTVSTTSANTGCTKTIIIPVTVNALPNAPVIVAGGPTALCAGSEVTLTLQGDEGVVNPTAPLDEVNGASLAVGLRKLNSNYNGAALRLRRSSDNAEQDFGFTGNNLDVNAITTWLGGADGYCTTLYDQSNNGGNVTQAINDKQPVFVLSGINNKPVLHFNSSQKMNNQVNYSSPFTAIYGARNTGGNSSERVLTSMNNNWLLGYWGNRMDVAFFEGWVLPESEIPAEYTVTNDYTIYAGKSNGSISSFFKNGNLLHSSNGGVTGPDGIAFNDASPNNEVSNFDITDLIIYPTDLSTANIVALNNSIGQYYGSGTLSSTSYTWSNGTTGSSTTVNQLGSYTVTKTNLNGCSSTSAPINVTLKNSTTSSTAYSACNNQLPYVWNGLTLNTAGTYSATLINAEGCDSVATIIFSIKNTASSLTNLTICNHELPYSWNGQTLPSAGTYSATLTGSNGCDSLATIVLSTIASPIALINANAPTTFCAGGIVTLTPANQPVNESALILPLDLNSTSVLAVGLRKLKSNYNGSIIRLRRESDNAEQDFGSVGINLDVEAINTWLQGSTGYCVKLYNQTGNVGGADVSQANQSKQPVYVANGIYNRPMLHFNTSQNLFNNTNYPVPFSIVYGSRVTGFAKRVLSSVNNNWWLGYWDGKMDNASFGNWLTSDNTPPVDNQYIIYTGKASGTSARLFRNGVAITPSTVGSFSGPNGIKLNGGAYPGEESEVDFTDVLIYNTNISPADVTLINNAVNSYYTYVDNSGVNYLWSNGATTKSITPTTTGNYTVTATAPNGCVLTSAPINVDVLNTTASTTELTVCSNQLPYGWNGLSLNETGTYTATLTNVAGCDSIATIIFSVINGASSLTDVTICSSELPYVWNNQNYTLSGNYTVTFAGSNGCDSVATLALNVNQTPEAVISVGGSTTICSGVSVNLNAGRLPIDEVGNATLAIGLRKLKSTYTGPALRLRRSSDNQEQDFGFAGVDLNVSAINEWLNGADGYCSVIYDQSGNGGDVTQPNAYAQPMFVASGINNKPILHFNTSMRMNNSVNYPPPYSAIYGSRVTGASYRVLASSYNNWLLGYWGGKEDRAFFEGWVLEGNVPTVTNQFNIYAAIGTGSLSTVYKNAVEIGSNNNGSSGPYGIQLNGSSSWGGETSDCDFTDIMIFGTALASQNIQYLNKSINDYYSNATSTDLSYLWSSGGETTPSIDVTTAGDYSVSITSNNGCNASSQVVTIQTVPAPTAFAVTGGGSYCVGGNGFSIGLAGSEIDIQYQLKMNGQNVGQSILGTGVALDFGVFTTQGRYTIEATNPNASCVKVTMNGFADVILNSLPNFAVTPSTASVCLGEAVQFTASSANNYCMPNNGYPYFANINQVHLNTLHSYLSGSQSQTHFNEPVDENTTTLVAGQSYELSFNTNGGATSAVWIDYNNNRLFEPSEWVRPLTQGNSGSAMINIPANAITGLTRMRVRSNYYWQISAEDACSDLSYGSTEDYMVTIQGGLPPETLQYTWNNGAFTGNTFVATPSASTAFTVSTTSANTGCTKTITIPVTVNALPNAPVIATSGASTLCAGGNVTLTLQSNEGVINPTVPLDEVNGASLAVGLRKLNSNYNGAALRLRRSSDDAEQDFGFTGNNLNVSAITSWLGGADGYCTTLYDQSNNGGDVTQVDNNQQPSLVLNGINNKPVLHFTTSQIMFNQVNYAAPFTAIYAAQRQVPSDGRVLSSYNNAAWLLGYWWSQMDVAYFDGWVTPYSNIPNTTTDEFTIYAGKSDGAVSNIYKNGNLIQTSSGGVAGPNGISLNSVEASNFDITDVIIYPTDLSTANIVALNNSIGQYYGTGTLSSASYTWSNGTTGTSTTLNQLGSYTVTKTNLNGCSITSEPIVIGKMTAEISGNETICAGTPANIYIDVNGDGPWSGTLSDGTPFSGTTSPIMVAVSPNTTTSYTIASLNGPVCSVNASDLSGEASVVVRNVVSASISGSVSTCNSEPATININVTGDGPWFGTLDDGTAFSGNSNIISVVVNPTATSVYSIASLNGEYCVANPDNLTGNTTVFINELVTGTIAGNNTICNGASAQLSITVTGKAPWSGTLNNGMTFSGSVSPILIDVAPTSTTTYSIASLNGLECSALSSNLNGTATIQVNNPTSSTTNVAVCNNQLPYNWNNNNYAAAGTYSVTLTGSNSCDSVATINLVVNVVTYSTTNISICSNQLPFVWNDISISNAGVYTKTLVNAMGCDSIATLNFSIKNISSSTTRLTLCSSNLPLVWNGLSLTSTGTYTRSFNNSVGCDSLAIIMLTVKQTSNIVDYVSAVGSYTWNGTTYTSSNNTAMWTGVNAAGCDSTVRLDLTITYDCTETDSTLNITACKVYIWKGIRSTTSTTLEWIGVNAGGCDSVVTLNLTITTLAPTVAPASITQTLVSNVCGAKVYRYTAAPSVNASGYQWILPNSVGGVSGVAVDSGDINNSITIRVRYTSNNAAITGDSIKVKAFSVCGSTTNRTVKLTNTLLTPPLAPASITATAISINTCGAKRYRYIAPPLTAVTTTAAAATGYNWSFKGTLGENAFIDSGNIGSQIITVTYSNNSAAATGDSVKVYYTSVCGNSATRALKLTNTLLSAPLAPTTVTITPVQTNVCGARKYRYSASALATATTSAMPATGWLWSLPAEGTVGSTGTIDSGDVNSQTIVMKYTSNAAAAAGDTIRVAYTSACGLSVAKATKLTNTSILAPLAPATVTVTPLVTNICGAIKYRYSAAGLVASTTTATAATGWLWTLPAEGTVGSTGIKDSGEINSQTIVVTYSSNAAAAAGDTIRVAYTSSCGLGAAKATKLTNTLLGAPLAPATVTIATVSDICGARVYRYTAPALPIATTTAGAANGYLWHMPTGTLGLTGVLDSGSLSSKVIRIRYSSNAAALTGDSIKLAYTSACGNSLPKALKLSNLAPSLLVAPATLTGTTSICSVVGTTTSNRYIATAVTGAVSYVWTLPAGAVLDSGSNGLRIKVRFLTAGANDSIYVQAVGTNGCAGAKKVLKLVTTGCVTQLISRTNVPTTIKTIVEPMQVNVYPNPSTSAFQMFVKTPSTSKIAMRILDIQGRLIKTISFNSDETIAFGNDLKSGVYMVEVREGNVVKTVRVLKY